MNRLTNLIKKFTLCFVVLTAMVSNMLIYNMISIDEIKAEYAPNIFSVSTSFENTSGDKYPLSLSGWSTLGTKSEDATMGIISTDIQDYSGSSFESFSEKTNLNFNPGTKNSDDGSNILMLNSKSLTKLGYQSEVIEFKERSFYHISLDVYTVYGLDDNANSFASVKITGENYQSNSNAYFDRIQTYNTWQTIDFYVASETLSTQEVKVELRLGNSEIGSYGVVFFDNFVCEEITNNQYYSKNLTYNNEMQTTTPTEIGGETYQIVRFLSFVDLSKPENFVSIDSINPDFENGLEYWTKLTNEKYDSTKENICRVFNVGTGSFDENSSKTTDPSNSYRYENNKALLLNNIEANYVGYKSQSFDVLKNEAYAIFIDAKTKTSTTAGIKIVQDNKNNVSNFTAISATNTSISTTSDNTNSKGGWETFVFYIKGNYAVDNTMHIELLLGSDSEQTGYVWFDNIRMQKISLAEYESKIANITGNFADLASDEELTLANGYFNNVTSTEVDGTLTPNLWTVETSSINTANAIVTVVDKDNKNNVLKIENKISTGTMVTSKEASITEKAYYLLKLDAKTDSITAGRTPYVSIYADDVLVYVLPLNTDTYAWTNYSLAIYNKAFTTKIKVALNLGGIDENDYKAKGIVYFDNITLVTSDETTFNSTTNTLNLTAHTFNDDFDKVNDLSNTELLNSLSYQNSTIDNNVESGILDLNNFDRISANNFPSITSNPHSNLGTYVYIINSSLDKYFVVKSTQAYKASANSFYKMTVTLKTIDIHQDSESVAEKDPIPCGAFIGLEGIDKALITGIDTKDSVGKYGYETYTIYLSAITESNFNLVFGLGQETSKTKGSLLVEKITLESIDTTAYDEAKKSNDKNILCVENKALDPEEDNEEEEDKKEETKSDVDFNFLILPTLITCLALIVAVVGVLIRKYGPKQRVKVSNEYDRAKVVKAHNLRETISQKETELASLNEKLEDSTKTLDKLQPTIDMTDEEILKNKDQMYDVENEIGQLKDKIIEIEKELTSLRKQLNKI